MEPFGCKAPSRCSLRCLRSASKSPAAHTAATSHTATSSGWENETQCAEYSFLIAAIASPEFCSGGTYYLSAPSSVRLDRHPQMYRAHAQPDQCVAAPAQPHLWQMSSGPPSPIRQSIAAASRCRAQTAPQSNGSPANPSAPLPEPAPHATAPNRLPLRLYAIGPPRCSTRPCASGSVRPQRERILLC